MNSKIRFGGEKVMKFAELLKQKSKKVGKAKVGEAKVNEVGKASNKPTHGRLFDTLAKVYKDQMKTKAVKSK